MKAYIKKVDDYDYEVYYKKWYWINYKRLSGYITSRNTAQRVKDKLLNH